MRRPLAGGGLVKVVYVAGPFRSPTHWGIVQNVRAAEAVALEVWRAGAVAICPHLNTANFQGALPDEAWLAGTLELLRRCDAMVLVAGWETSTGTGAEIKEAKRRKMPVFEGLGDMRDWIGERAR
jgi:hypothetical protein